MLPPFLLPALLIAAQAASQPASGEGAGPASLPAEGPASMPAEGPSSMPAEAPAQEPADDDDGDEAPSTVAPEAPSLLARVLGPDAPRAPTAGLVTSRPGFTESAHTLAPGHVLVNVALGMESTLDDGLLLSAAALDAPAVLLRVGVLDYLELRAGASWRITRLRPDLDFDTPPQVSSGVGAVTVGGSVKVLEERAFLPGLAVVVSGDVPLTTLRLGSFSAEALATVEKRFLDRFTLGASAGAGWDGGAERFRFPVTAITSLDIGLGIGVFAEAFGDVYLDTLPSLWADGGLYYDVSERIRLDASLGVNAFGSQGTWLAQAGLSWML